MNSIPWSYYTTEMEEKYIKALRKRVPGLRQDTQLGFGKGHSLGFEQGFEAGLAYAQERLTKAIAAWQSTGDKT